ncbi:MAG: hypothetical protein J7578_07975 [Chitinophagaceae bacterium]|nr:hypothetical protein [Chitinophagaceae bacterium]
MKKTRFLLYLIICCSSVFAQQPGYLVEAESFQFKGGWYEEKSGPAMGNSILRVQGTKHGAADALTVIAIKEKAQYTVWVRAMDFKEKPGTRLFRLFVDEHPMEEAGKHGNEGFAWEKVGTVALEAKQVLLRLKDTKKNFARCDAILLSADAAFDPNSSQLPDLAKLRTKSVPVQVTESGSPQVSPYLLLAADSKTIAEISNGKVQLRFATGGINNKSIVTQTFIEGDGEWRSLNRFQEDHKVYLLSSQDPSLTFGNFFPSWNGSKAISWFEHDGKKIELQEPKDLLNPFMAGDLSEAIPVEAKKINNNRIDVRYVTSDGSMITGIWTLEKNSAHISVKLHCQVARSGYYSMALAAFQGIPADKITNIQMPPMFQYKRLSPQPVMLVSAMMQQPIAIAETKSGNGLFSSFVCADPSTIPSEWGTPERSPMGFAIRNESGSVQPVAFAPVLGLEGSKLKEGQTIEKGFVIGALNDNWQKTLEYVSDQVFKVKDYRKQEQGSLTDAVFNMIDLVKNDEAAGWSKELKGFYDIEGDPSTAPTVVHPSPLTLLSTAVITKDEDFYLTRALPVIEYTLSRSGYRWAKDIVPTGYNNSRKTLLLNPLNSQFTTAYYEGLYRFTNGSNPWIDELAMPGGKPRTAAGYSVNIPAWVQELAAYRLTKENKWLTSASANADKFLTTQLFNNTITPMGKGPFYNSQFYAYWWNLLDLYEQTKDDKYLKAAEAGAFMTIAGIRSLPQVRDTVMTIHPGNKYEGNTTLWWKGNQKYRLGFPRQVGDAPEKQVPQSLVSPVGLGFEQPFTYFDPGKTVRPVFMSSWAPHLLRLYQYTKRDIFLTYARNAVIGRFTNYPGYYATGFTDITMKPDFPYKGPDVSSIYYHHIPAHLSFSWDYLITEAIQRSNNKVVFPYSQQDGFVWFTNRQYGAEKGTIFDDKQVKLWMKRGLVELNTPEVNYISGISKDRFWVVLMSESEKELPVTVKIDKGTGVAANAVANLYTSERSKPTKAVLNNSGMAVTIAPKGLTAISFPLSHTNQDPVFTTVKDGMKIGDLGEPWGKMFLFRIRAPFGWDSMYGCMETAPIDGAQVTVTCNGRSVTSTTYPFEWSFPKLGMGEKATLRIQYQSAGQPEKETTIIMEGN